MVTVLCTIIMKKQIQNINKNSEPFCSKTVRSRNLTRHRNYDARKQFYTQRLFFDRIVIFNARLLWGFILL